MLCSVLFVVVCGLLVVRFGGFVGQERFLGLGLGREEGNRAQWQKNRPPRSIAQTHFVRRVSRR